MAQHGWPEWSDTFIKSGFPEHSLLAGTEPVVWAALGRLELEDFNSPKQVTLRKALEDVGLGWVATNTTPFRIAVGGLFDAARETHRRIAEGNHRETGRTASTNPVIHVETNALPEGEYSITGPLHQGMVTESCRKAVWRQLESYGACAIRQAVVTPMISAEYESTDARKTKLARTMGNGIAGEPQSIYMGLANQSGWHEALISTLQDLLAGPGTPYKSSESSGVAERRSILLLAGDGAENWAHQDNNDETPPVQAVLMLSDPQVDFSGGEFYVARQIKNTESEIHIQRYTVRFESPGDLVIFIAGKRKGWWHGMLPVRAPGHQKPGQEYVRRAVGMLQPGS